MMKQSTDRNGWKNGCGKLERLAGLAGWVGAGMAGMLLLVAVAGCESPQARYSSFRESALAQSTRTSASSATGATGTQSESMTLREGDVVKISFPGAPNLNTTQQIRRDGKIALPLVGEFKAAGLKPSEMEALLLEKYAPQLVTKEVTVTVENAAYPIFVTGAVLRPGKLVYDRPVTALEAVMEAGVDYSKANLKGVKVIRQDRGRTQHYQLNLKRVLQGQQGEPFPLKSSDIIFVPERFSWF